MTYKGKIDQIKVYESKEGYAQYAPLYKKDEAFLNTFDQKLFMRLLRDISSYDILDLGCGSGRLIPLLKKRGATSIVGLDIAQEMLALAAQLHVYKDLVCADIQEALPFDWDSFDMIFATLLLVHIPDKKLPHVCEELYRVVRPHGVVYIGNIMQRRPPMLTSLEGEKFYIKSYQHADETIVEYLEDAGFTDIQVYEQQEKSVHIASVIEARKM